MENLTSFKEFQFLAFSTTYEHRLLLFSVFSLIYVIGVLLNLAIILVVCSDSHLHCPMYVFLCNLSIVDICYTSATVPKLLDMLLSGKRTMSLMQCFSQMYFYWMSGGIEDTLLFTMAFDRYVAICKPLHYHLVFSRKNYIKLVVGIWISGCLNSLSITVSAAYMNFCHSNTILQFFCDAKALTNIACAITDAFYAVIYFNLLFFGLCPCVFSLTSYVKIIRVILSIKSKGGRKKAFSTCSSHLTVLLLYYGTGLPVYLSPPSNHTTVLEQTFSVFYTMVTPMLNPLIYSLRNEEVKKALLNLVRLKDG